ncbi:MAG: PEP-CTERM sorting domain-containing protein [Myxococcota bacterium]|nr:PEP-CTERM sorting domain-containing protein [Myxococcota bacterium]
MRCRPEHRLSRWLHRSLVQLLLLASWAVAADAAQIDVFFNGPGNFGMSEADAITARDTAGVPWLLPTELSSGSGFYSVTTSEVLSFSPVPPTGTDNRALESWRVQNVSGSPLDGTSYLLFGESVPFEKNGVFISFDPENVGLTIDALNWVIIPVESTTNYYYPAVRLTGVEVDGAFSDPFDVNYVVTEPLPQAPASSGLYQLPRFGVARGFTPIPEPGAGLLLAAGLAALSLRRFRSR